MYKNLMANTYKPQSMVGFHNSNRGNLTTRGNVGTRSTMRNGPTLQGGPNPNPNMPNMVVVEPIHQDPVYTDEVVVQSHVPTRRTRDMARDIDPEVAPKSKRGTRSVVYESNSVPFTSIITPMTGLEATNSTNGSDIRFELVRDHLTGINTLTWEPFKGIVLGGGTECLEVQQSITHLPDHINDIPITIEVKGVRKSSFVRIDPYTNHNIKFYLDISGKGTMISDNDKVFVPACTVSWKSKK